MSGVRSRWRGLSMRSCLLMPSIMRRTRSSMFRPSTATFLSCRLISFTAPTSVFYLASWLCSTRSIFPSSSQLPIMPPRMWKPARRIRKGRLRPRQPSLPDNAPENVETGTQNQEGMVGAGAAVDFLASLAEGESRRARLAAAYTELHQRSADLTRRLWNGLASIHGVRLYGPSPDMPRTPTVSFTVDGVASTEVARRLATRGLFLSHGDFYAATVVERLGLGEEGLVRAGCACYTTADEIERLIQGVSEIG